MSQLLTPKEMLLLQQVQSIPRKFIVDYYYRKEEQSFCSFGAFVYGNNTGESFYVFNSS